MSPEQLQALRDKITVGCQPVDRSPWAHNVHPRGWNDALDFVEKCIKEVTGEKP
jgi:hypothetical protein